MKIFHMITTICRGGAENQLAILAREQILAGHEVTIIPLKGELELLETFIAIGAKVDLQFHDLIFLKQWFKVKKLNHQQIDILHLHLPQAEILGISVKKSIKISTRHFGDQFFPRRNKLISKFLSRMASKSCSIVVAISNSVAAFLRENREVNDSSKICVIPYGYQLKSWKEKPSSDLRPKKNGFQIEFGTLARLSEEKDLPTMFRGFAIAAEDSNFHANLKVFGEGPERQNLQELINSLGMSSRISMPGRTDKPFEELLKLDVFVLTSRYEGFGMVLLEAMAASKPIICSSFESAREVLGESGAALFFPVGDPAKLAELYRDWNTILPPTWRKQQELQLSFFRADEMSKNIQGLYEKLLSSDRTNRKRKVS